MWVYNQTPNELSHTGVMGMKWGHRSRSAKIPISVTSKKVSLVKRNLEPGDSKKKGELMIKRLGQPYALSAKLVPVSQRQQLQINKKKKAKRVAAGILLTIGTAVVAAKLAGMASSKMDAAKHVVDNAKEVYDWVPILGIGA